MQTRVYNKTEQLIYVGTWGIAFLAPLFTMLSYAQLSPETFSWQWVLPIWSTMTGFIVAFFIHNYAIAPLFIYKHKWGRYFLALTCLVAAFYIYQSAVHPEPTFPATRLTASPQSGAEKSIPFNGHNIIRLIILLLLMGVNLGVKAMFKSYDDRKRLERLQKENLTQELQYLKYQISPHFFMNTLNNIHALVDINPDQAKSTIVDLSKMMRYLLYDGAKEQIPLRVEASFIDNYIKLMRLRYPASVSIDVNIAEQLPDRTVPPLLLITFVGNAFKHGVSYQKPSFIKIDITANNEFLKFNCNNSKQPLKADTTPGGGVGLANAKKRLDLIYGNSYTLTIDDGGDTFSVALQIPFQSNNTEAH